MVGPCHCGQKLESLTHSLTPIVMLQHPRFMACCQCSIFSYFRAATNLNQPHSMSCRHQLLVTLLVTRTLMSLWCHQQSITLARTAKQMRGHARSITQWPEALERESHQGHQQGQAQGGHATLLATGAAMAAAAQPAWQRQSRHALAAKRSKQRACHLLPPQAVHHIQHQTRAPLTIIVLEKGSQPDNGKNLASCRMQSASSSRHTESVSQEKADNS